MSTTFRRGIVSGTIDLNQVYIIALLNTAIIIPKYLTSVLLLLRRRETFFLFTPLVVSIDIR